MLIDSMNQQLSQIPGLLLNDSQPIRDNVDEAVAGIPASLAVKVFGSDFNTMDSLATKVQGVLGGIDGVEDLGVLRNLGQPEACVMSKHAGPVHRAGSFLTTRTR